MANDLNMGMKCIKYMLLTVDVMFLLTATLIISIGATIFAIFTDFSFFIHDGYYSPVNLLIAIGFIMLCVSIFGCVGAIKESTMLINVFAFLLSLVFILEIAAAITAYSLQSGLYNLIEDNLERGINSYNTSSDAMESVDFLQSRLGCCGIESPNDWDSKYTSNQTLSLGEVAVPDSCCGRYSNNLPSIDSCNSQISYRKGCMKQLVSLIGQSTVLLGTGAMTIAFIQFLGIIFAVVLGKAIRQAKTDRERRRWEIREQIVNNYTQMEPHQGKKMPENPTPVIYVPPIGHSTS